MSRFLFSLAFILIGGVALAAPARPNVILIMTDDQGYGDLACHGNPVLKTPHLDRLYAESVRFTDFHVSPFCTPTRAALLTGRYPARTGAYRTSSGRTMLHTDENTIADLFGKAGYVTGMMGKWHLGDNAPHRPQDRGFQDAVWHRCGGIGQASDYFGNDYFDDTYERNGRFEKFEGYCTDVFFREAMRFVEKNREQPFFLYIPANAPHGPYLVERKWSDPYSKKVTWGKGAEFYGMIANIDHNVGLLREKLRKLDLTTNTILIFMTDNGTARGAKFEGLDSEAVEGFNAGMRGKKSSIYEGGHRVPFFIHWPAGGLTGGRDIIDLAAHIDVLPSLADLCEVKIPQSLRLDGVSFAQRLRNSNAMPPRNHLIVQFHGGAFFSSEPRAWEYTCVLHDRWRLIDGKQLFHLDADPAQRTDVASEHPDVVSKLRDYYEPFWKSVSPRMTPVSIDLGNASENPVMLCSQDWYMPKGNPPWNFGTIRKRVPQTGPWMVDIKKEGRYRFSLRQLPPEAPNAKIVGDRARIRVAGKEREADVQPGAESVDFELELPAGKTKLETWFFDEQGIAGGAYFTQVERLSGPVLNDSAKPVEAERERPRLQILNGSNQAIEIYWLKNESERVSNGKVAPGKQSIITTTIGHEFAVVGTNDGTEMTVTSKVPVQSFRFDPPDKLGVPAFYTQRIEAAGFPIVASKNVNPYALKEAAYLVNLMLAKRPDVRTAMIESGSRLCILAWNEFTTDQPEWKRLEKVSLSGFPGVSPKEYRDARARGMGGSLTDPFCSCAEENLLGYPGDPYAAENILIHELAHNIHLRGMSNVDPTFDRRLKKAYDDAMKAGLWKGKYPSVNHHEYFAEGVQSWFDDNRENDHDHNHVNTRAELIEYDPGLADLCREVFGDTELKYTKPATRLRGHLAGYDPSMAPTFVWPERLNFARKRIRAAAEARNKAAAEGEKK